MTNQPGTPEEILKHLAEQISRTQHKLEVGSLGFTSARLKDEESISEAQAALLSIALEAVSPVLINQPITYERIREALVSAFKP